MASKFNLSQELKDLQKYRIKIHLYPITRGMLYNEEYELWWNKLFTDNLDNRSFWWFLINRFSFGWVGTLYKDYYDAIQKWYNQLSIQDFKKNEYLDFTDYSWKKEKVGWNDFYERMKTVNQPLGIDLAKEIEKAGALG